MPSNLLKIALVAPILAMALISLWLGLSLLVVSPVIWVFSVAFSLPLSYSFDWIIRRLNTPIPASFFVALSLGVLGGLVAYLLLFMGSLYSYQLAAEYIGYGALVSLISYALYFKGPLRVTT